MVNNNQENQTTIFKTRLPPRQNHRHFADNSFKRIAMNEKFCILIKILLRFVPKGPIDDNPELI